MEISGASLFALWGEGKIDGGAHSYRCREGLRPLSTHHPKDNAFAHKIKNNDNLFLFSLRTFSGNKSL